VKLKSLTLKNFKAINSPVRFDFKPITLLFGPNSSGKSTIIQALHYAYEIFERRNIDPGQTLFGGKSIDLGGFESLVHKHNLNKSIIIRLDIDLKDGSLLPDYSTVEEADTQEEQDFRNSIITDIMSIWVELEIKFCELIDKTIVTGYEVGINGDLLCNITSSSDGRQVQISHINFSNPLLVNKDETSEDTGINLWEWTENIVQKQYLKNDEVQFGIINMDSALPYLGFPLKLNSDIWETEHSTDHGIEYSVKNYKLLLSSLIVGPGELTRNALRKFLYLGPLRDVPSRNYIPELSPNLSRWANGLAAWDILYKANDKFINSFNDWFARKDRLNTGYHIELKRFKELEVNNPISLSLEQGYALDEDERIYEYLKSLPIKNRFYLWDEINEIEVLPQDIGVGISQLLPVIVAALYSQKRIVAIEQPELHIHPAIQVALGDLFITQSKKQENIFLIETHSEHLLLRLLRRIRENYEDELLPDIVGLLTEDISIYYLESNNDGMIVQELKVNQQGDSSNKWPKGFFEERHGELF